MAEVFVARCGELPGMQSLLAVKRILPHLADDERFIALFRREAQISLRLRHRAIAQVIEVGRDGPSWFLAMELVAGESLAHLLRAEREQGGGVDPRLVAWVGAEIASALHHAHALTDGKAAMPVIHRDVSPQNLLMGFDGTVKLIDFGVARCVRFSDATRTGTVRGKLAYASPEQLGARSLDGRSDLFSLAIVLHEWLAGALLFERDSDAATVQAVQTAPIPPLPRVPALGAVLARALERSPERRYPDGESLAEALLEAVGGRPAAPERLVADHLAALFPDRKLRWQAITAGRDVDHASLELARTRGGTERGTPVSSLAVMEGLSAGLSDGFSERIADSSSQAPSVNGPDRPGPAGRVARAPVLAARVRRRWAPALVATAALAGVLVTWMRHDRSSGPMAAASSRTAASMAPSASPVMVTPPPAVTPERTAPPAAPVSAVAVAVAAADLPRARAEKKSRRPPVRINRGDRRARAALTPPRERNSDGPDPSPGRRAVVEELERSTYATPR
jgi:serine/threonine protein kinase